MNEFKEGLQIPKDHLLETSELKIARDLAIKEESDSYKKL